MERKKIGLIAGKGAITIVSAKAMKENGMEIIAIALSPEIAADIKPFVDKFYIFSPVQLGGIIDKLKEEGINELLMIGKVEKDLLFRNLKFDLRAVKLLGGLSDRQDGTILKAIVNELLLDGITVLKQSDFLSHLFPQPGVLTKRSPTEKEKEDISFGMDIVQKIAEFDISQTIVVKDKTILAVEAIEGTKDAIKRGAGLCKGAVIIKTSKKNQDERFDIATVGLETIKVMSENKASCLAIKYRRTFVVDKEEVIKMADEAGISIVVVE